jgi:UDP-N-acetylmuramoyl-tripeptide--D-alanyl-D-alanine ligase
MGRVHAAEASLNNHLGVPLTLARLPREADFAVIEIGMSNPGEIAPLARLARPDVVLITTIAAAHLEALGSLEAIAREKASICEGLVAGGVAVLPAGLAQTQVFQEAAQAAGARVCLFGPAGSGADWTLAAVQSSATATEAVAQTPAGALDLFLAAPGSHFAANALGVLAAGVALGGNLVALAEGLRAWAPPAGRGNRARVLADPTDPESGFEVIDDAFNANPASMAAAIAVLAAARPPGAGGRRIAVLGDMLELGPDEAALHAGLAALPGFAAIDIVHCVGPRMRALWQAVAPAQRGQWAATAAEMAAQARDLAGAGDVVLVKGSKGSKVSAVAGVWMQTVPQAGRAKDVGGCSTG